MNITFFIGNGFDINLGLKTRYTDFLSEYVKKDHEGSLPKEIKKKFDSWADLEKQLGVYAGTVSKEEAARFNEEKEALEDELIEYLRFACLKDLVISQEGISEFRQMVTGFSKYLPSVEQEHYKSVLSGIREVIRYQFIDFNYTSCLDKIVDESKKIKPFGNHIINGIRYEDEIWIPIHIHGELYDELVLGVNDCSQIGNGKTEVPPQIAEYLIKSNVNNKLGNQKIKQVQEVIEKSAYVCVFGMSLGVTDKDWWCYLGKWLEKSPARRLILFMYDGSGAIFSGSKRARKEDQVRSRFINMIERTDIEEQLNRQIVVVINSSIFHFENIMLESEKEEVT